METAEVTNRIRVDVATSYVEDQSNPTEGRFVFSYTITIRNEGQVAARLMTRHWIITDANGKVQEVAGRGRRGRAAVPEARPGLPILEWCHSRNPGRLDAGQLSHGRGRRRAFDAPIAPFTLAMPGMLH